MRRCVLVQPEVGVPDTGDLVDTIAPDPTPDEITDPEHHDYVEPYTGATAAELPEITMNKGSG